MFKILLLLLIFANISTKTVPTLEYDIITTFNKDKCEFIIDSSSELTGLLTYVDTPNKKLNISYYCESNGNGFYDEKIFTSPGGAYIFILPFNAINSLNISALGGEEIKEGTIWIHPLDLELSTDLSEKIEKKYPIKVNHNYESFNFTISDLEEDKTVLFNYEKEYKDEEIDIKDLANPFSVCEDLVCLDDIDSFTFVKGNAYTIKMKFESRTIKVGEIEKKLYFLPAFSFYKIDPPKLEYGVKTPFYMDKHIFNFEYSGKSTDFLVYVDTKKTNLNITYVSKKSFITSYESCIAKTPGSGCSIYVTKNCNNILHINSLDGQGTVEGNIWIYPLNNDIDISKTLSVQNDYPVMADEDLGPLTFYISEATENDLYFKYKKEYKDENVEVKNLQNPFKICNGEKCKEKIDKYKLEKNGNYTIQVKFEEKTVKIKGEEVKRYFLPGHSFTNQKDNARFLGLSLIYFILLLLF